MHFSSDNKDPEGQRIASPVAAEATAGALNIDLASLDALLPMHLYVDPGGMIGHAGRTMKELARCGGDIVGRPFFDAFDVLKPRGVSTIEDLAKRAGKNIRLQCQAEEDSIVLRSTVQQLPDGGLLFDATLGAGLVDHIEDLGLRSKDFSISDATVDLLYMVQTQKALLEDSQSLVDRLEVAKAEAEALALSDSLTGLANRRAVTRYFEEIAASGNLESFGLIHVDLDHFKHTNDQHGHAAGDAILKRTASILTNAAGIDAMVARIGGDEFMVIIMPVTLEALERIAAEVIVQISMPFHHFEKPCRTGASLGVVLSNATEILERGHEQLIANADLALYEAKQAGRNRYSVFTAEMREEQDRLLALEVEIGVALREGQILPFFQPQIDLQENRISGFEALARWRHPVRGLLSPHQFLFVAERSNLIRHIDEAISEQAIAGAAAMRDAGLGDLDVSINFNASQLGRFDLTDILKWQADRFDVAPEHVVVEILESVALDSHEALRVNLAGLKHAGFRLHLDDFGTEHAALSTVLSLALDAIKIDRSFIRDVALDERKQKMVSALIRLMNDIGMEVICEGIETRVHLETLTRIGHCVGQGYYFSNPLPLSEAIDWSLAYNNSVNRSVLRKRHI